MNDMQNELNIPEVALGIWSWGGGSAGADQVFGNHYTQQDLKPVFDAGISSGLNLWDTAAVYGMGSSESYLGEFLKDINRTEVILSTKFTPQIAANTQNAVEDMLKESMNRLNTDYIDIYWIHNPADIEKWTPQLIPLAKSGKIKYIGVSNHNLDEIRLANEILSEEGLKVSAVQNHYSLLHRTSEESGIINYCHENDMTFFSYMVLEQGALSGTYGTKHPFPTGSDRAIAYNENLPKLDKLIDTMKKIAKKHDATVAQIATAWAIAKGTVPIVGITKVSHVDDAVKSSNIQLTEDDIMEMEKMASHTGVETIREWEKQM